MKLQNQPRRTHTMLSVRRSAERGYADHGWLKSHHSFSFADYYDPSHMGVGNLRVINEDRMGNGTAGGAHAGVIRPGDVQRMSAGTGVLHSEFNNAPKTTHFLQIWLLPNVKGITPSYEQRRFEVADKRGKLALVAADEPRDGALKIHADA